MKLLYYIVTGMISTRKKGEKSLNEIQGNGNLPGHVILESSLYLSFQRYKCEDRIIIAFIKSV